MLTTYTFYPYAAAGHSIEINIDLKKPDIDKLSPDDIQLTFGPAALHEEIKTWKEVYGIDERYKAKCCSETDGKSWINTVLIERENYGLTTQAMLVGELKTAQNQPFSDSNFLKKPFLEACQRAGLFDPYTRTTADYYCLTKPQLKEKLRVDQWREKEATRDAVRQAIYDFLWNENTGLPVTCFAEQDVEVKTEDVFRHIYRAYPTVPSPYFSAHAAM